MEDIRCEICGEPAMNEFHCEQCIDSILKIQAHCKFNRGECYVLSVHARKKNNRDLRDSTEIIRRSILTNKNDIADGYSYLKRRAMTDPSHEYYMYISVNPRNMKKGIVRMIKSLTDILFSFDNDDTIMPRVRKIPSLYYSCIESDKSKSGKVKHFMVDVDDKGIIRDVINLMKEMGISIVSINESKNGYHVIVKPFDVRQFSNFEDRFGKDFVGLKKDGITFIENFNGD